MSNYHHKKIHKFFLEGEIHDEAAIARLKIEYTKTLALTMKMDGYVPRLDIEPDFTIEYIQKNRTFTFKLSIYGVYVGKKNAEWIIGIDGHQAISTQQSKLSELLRDQA